jgi:bilin biosynthesis protein
MDKRFFNLFNLTEDEAIALLDTPIGDLDDPSDKYIAASHLINYPTEASIAALMRVIQTSDPAILDDRIVRRKALESLGRLQAPIALPVIEGCLSDPDPYVVENAIWAIGEIREAAPDQVSPDLLESVAQVLDRPGQNYRVAIQTLVAADYQAVIPRLSRFTEDADEPTRSAAIAAICRLSGDYSQIDPVIALLQSDNINGRRGAIQDLIDVRYYPAIPAIARCPVSVVFRLRAVRQLLDIGVPAGALTFAAIEPILDRVLRDHPQDLEMVHEYDLPPSPEFLIRELFQTDFGRCYLATQTLLDRPDEAPAWLLEAYRQDAHNDYGAHYHVIKCLGWLRHAPAYDLLIDEGLNNREPQFQKSRAAAAIALGELASSGLDLSRGIAALQACLTSPIWDLKYGVLLALEAIGDYSGHALALADTDWLIQAKARSALDRRGG